MLFSACEVSQWVWLSLMVSLPGPANYCWLFELGALPCFFYCLCVADVCWWQLVWTSSVLKPLNHKHSGAQLWPYRQLLSNPYFFTPLLIVYNLVSSLFLQSFFLILHLLEYSYPAASSVALALSITRARVQYTIRNFFRSSPRILSVYVNFW